MRIDGDGAPGADRAAGGADRSAGAKQRRQPDDAAELRQAAQQFEAHFLEQLLKQARASARLLGGENQPEIPGRDIFESWQDESYAESIAGAGGLGLAEMLVRQLQPPPPRPLPEPGTPGAPAQAEAAPAGGAEATLPAPPRPAPPEEE